MVDDEQRVACQLKFKELEHQMHTAQLEDEHRDKLMNETHEMVQGISGAILGNGKRGLKTDVAILQYGFGLLTPVVLGLIGKVLWDFLK